MLQAFAKRAIGVGKHRHFQLAVAAHFFNRHIQRQGGKIDFIQFGAALVGEALAGVDINQVAHQHVIGAAIDINHLVAAHHHFIKAGNRRVAHALHFQVLALVGLFQFGRQRLRQLAIHIAVCRCCALGCGRGRCGAVVGYRRLAAGGQRQQRQRQ